MSAGGARRRGGVGTAAQRGRWGRYAGETYARLHGVQPEKVAPYGGLPATPHALVDLGALFAVEYLKRTPRGIEGYRHVFRRSSRPDLAHDEQGRLHVLGGSYTTTSHGIEDRMSGYNFKKIGAFTMRSNPGIEATIVEYLEIGAIAFVATVLMDILSDRVTSITEKTKGIAKGILGVGAGVLLAKKYPMIGLGVGIAGVVSATDTLYREMGVQAYINNAISSIGSGTGGTTQQLPAGGQQGTTAGVMPRRVRVGV